MPSPIALCIEVLDPDGGSPRFVQCVAVPGLEPGLRVGSDGRVLWMHDSNAAFVLCVSGDDRLVLYKPAEAADCGVSVHRSGRSVAASEGKPIVLLDRDRIEVGGVAMRVHVHGAAASVHEPRLLPPQPARWKFRTAAATLALGAVIGAASGTASGQTAEPQEPSPDGGGAGGAQGSPDSGTESDASHDAEAGIEVRDFPPVIVREPPAGCCARNPGAA